MCGIAGFIDFKSNFLSEYDKNTAIAKRMANKMLHRGPDAEGVWVSEYAVFAHRRLAVIDIDGGAQPMKRTESGYDFVITYNGELYNTADIKNELSKFGYHFTTNSDTEVLLYAYIHYGEKCVDKLNGIYAFGIWDSMRQRVFMCRDRFGVKPLFYTCQDSKLIFGSEIKVLFEYPNVKRTVSRDGLCEIFAIGPPRTQGLGVFDGISELEPAHYMIIDRDGIKKHRYWQFESRAHTDSYEDTVAKVRFLMVDAVKRQLVSDVPICTFLSGGLDSSVITAIAANTLREQGKQLDTYSFDYVDNSKYFKASKFQPDSDRPWVERMVDEFKTHHTFLECDNSLLEATLENAVLQKDLPGMADVDSSLLYFCSRVKEKHTVALSGECSDEIFGGYPWFRDKSAFDRAAFPWSYDMYLRESVLKADVRSKLNVGDYAHMRYEESIAQVPAYSGDTAEEKRRREISYLNINWFMLNLLERKDRMSMASGLEVRVPFCDYNLAEYVWNIPWEFKCRNDVSKSLLRDAMRGILPDDVLMRKKSPYPKTHNPLYEMLVKKRMQSVLENPSSPILELVDSGKIKALCEGSSDYGKPFFGQLMAGPQFIAYLLQVNYWLKDYNVDIK